MGRCVIINIDIKQKYLVFSDLDGTLLSHKNYDFSEARESLNFLKKRSIPVILSTSKTFAEVVKIQKQMHLNEPFIVENGGGIFIPKKSILASKNHIINDWLKISNTANYLKLRLFFKKIQKRYKILGFADMGYKEIMKLTNLNKQSVQDAMKRDFTEPFIIQDISLIPNLKKEARKDGFDIIKGGRFFHLISKNQNKVHAMLKLRNLYSNHHNQEIKTIALGDSHNDFLMLNKADIGVLIPQHDGIFAPITTAKHIKYAKHPGPKGWNKAIKEIFHAK